MNGIGEHNLGGNKPDSEGQTITTLQLHLPGSVLGRVPRLLEVIFKEENIARHV